MSVSGHRHTSIFFVARTCALQELQYHASFSPSVSPAEKARKQSVSVVVERRPSPPSAPPYDDDDEDEDEDEEGEPSKSASYEPDLIAGAMRDTSAGCTHCRASAHSTASVIFVGFSAHGWSSSRISHPSQPLAIVHRPQPNPNESRIRMRYGGIDAAAAAADAESEEVET